MKHVLATVPHAEIKTFMKESVQKPGPYKTIYVVLSTLAGLAIGALIAFSVTVWVLDGFSGHAIQAGLAVLFSLTLLIVIHEGIHGVAYKFFGAKNVYYGGNIKQFVFYAASDGDVFNGRQFRAIAFAPFVTVSVICLLLILFLPQYVIFLGLVLSLHTLFCGGDFLFIHFLSHHDLARVRTHDNRAEAVSYFYYVD